MKILCFIAVVVIHVVSSATTRANFIHPGLLHTENDFARMRVKVQTSQSPWIDGWKLLTANDRSQLWWNARPTSTIIRGGDGTNVALLYRDVHAAYQLAVRWKVSGDDAYANKSISIMNAWSATLQTIGGNADRFLAVGLHGYQFANAAEIMRTYAGWAPDDFARFQNMMLTVFYPMSHNFLEQHNGAAITNYWANWDLCNMATVLAIGVLCDRRDIYDEAINYFYEGGGNGAIHKAVYHIHNGNLGQWQESGRDQGHNTLGIVLMGVICEMAWNQGDDLYGYWNSRFLAGAEYVGKFNLGYDVPYQPYMWGTGQHGGWSIQSEISYAGHGSTRPMWELVYGHYYGRMGIATPYTQQSLARTRPEGGASDVHASAYDTLGFGTLTFARDPEKLITQPSSLVAFKSAENVILSWWGNAGAVSYNVKRSNRVDGPFTIIGTSKEFTYVDTNLTSGKYYYIVTGVNEVSMSETAPSNVAVVSTVAELHVHLNFDETNVKTARDDTGNGNNALLFNSATFTPGKKGNALLLDGTNSYASLPSGLITYWNDLTISAWVYMDDNNRQWARIFDFGGKPGTYMFLTSRSSRGTVRFAIGTVYWYNEQIIDSNTILPNHMWIHIAVTLSGRVGTIYINGVVDGMNDAIDLQVFQLGVTSRNWIGRSQYANDPYMKGRVDDFRIYNAALSANEIARIVKE